MVTVDSEKEDKDIQSITKFVFQNEILTQYFGCWAELILFVYSRTSNFSAIWRLSPSTGYRAANFGLCSALRAFEQGDIFIVPHLLRHRTSVYTASSERPVLYSSLSPIVAPPPGKLAI
jgi:hypothetical protein